MATLRKAYNVKVVKYNFNNPFMTFNKELDNFPTEEDLLNILAKIDGTYPEHKNFRTTLHIDGYYKVIRSLD